MTLGRRISSGVFGEGARAEWVARMVAGEGVPPNSPHLGGASYGMGASVGPVSVQLIRNTDRNHVFPPSLLP